MLTFFGGEPLLNLPVAYYLAERLWQASQARGVRMLINVITNGLLLTPEVVDRLAPYGLNGVKITLDGDRDTHNRMRPLRGGQGTFDKIIDNVRQVAGKCRISIGGNFDEIVGRQLSGAARLPARAGVRRQARAGRVQADHPRADGRQQPKGLIPLTVVGAERQAAERHVHDVGRAAARSICDNCNFLDDKMSFLREETKKRGFPTIDGVHMGPCEIHRQHAHTIGPDGALYACPGFTGDAEAVDRPHRRPAGRPARPPRPRGSRRSRRGRSATTARSSRSAPAAARSPRTPSSAT